MITHRVVEALRPCLGVLVLFAAGAAGAAEIAPHRALYTMSLGATHGDAAVTAGRLTQAQEDSILTDLKQHITDLVNGKAPNRPFDHDFRGGPPAAFE